MASLYVAESIGTDALDWAVYPVTDGRVLRGRRIARFDANAGVHALDARFHALLFIRALELADAGAPIMDGIIDDD